ncbi:MAG TPA: helix-turn-helix transcriptional regulator [Pyrinomonadaceae bacterium]|jgi:transcriptional regulator with XRE-family HTH domain|nr:helix-turn-helix transcriptional regulator [Pyrinomonadaceae bacterium]
MGHARSRPQRLAEKLLQIRNALGLSQTELWKRLGVEDEIPYTRISDYELDKSEPTLMILLQYARVASVHVEALIDDDLDLPEKLPGPVRYGETARAYVSRSRTKKR